MLRPLGSAPTTVAAVLLLASIACGSGSQPDASPTEAPTTDAPATDPPATSTPTPSPAGPAVTFTTRSNRTATLTVEIAATPEEHSVGLMNRQSLPEDAGMLFVWTEDTGSAFYMKNTLIPLSIAFIDANGIIIHIEDMEPLDETLHHAPAPYRYAVEANQGWFADYGIVAGDTVTLPEEAA